MRTALLIVVVLLAVAIGPAAQDAADWPQWRGPNRDGTLVGFTAPATWPEALTRQWTVEVGEGYATPVLVGDRLYVFARQGANEVMRALDAATGDVLWERAYAAPFSFERAAEPHGPGPKATPTYADGRLFTLGLGGVVTAWHADTGDTVWQHPAPVIGPLYGTSISPLVDGAQVIVHVGGHDQGALTSFDTVTGTVNWAWEGDGPSYASPVMAELAGSRQVVTLSQDRVIGVSSSTGELLWERPFSTGAWQNVIDPLVIGDEVIIGGFREPTERFRVVRQPDGWRTEAVWVNPDVELYMTNGVLVDDGLFGLSMRERGQFFLLDINTGETLWASPGRQAENAAIARAGEMLLVLEDDAELVIGRVSPAGFDEVRRYRVAESATWAQPAIVGNRVFVKDLERVTLWTIE